MGSSLPSLAGGAGGGESIDTSCEAILLLGSRVGAVGCRVVVDVKLMPSRESAKFDGAALRTSHRGIAMSCGGAPLSTTTTTGVNVGAGLQAAAIIFTPPTSAVTAAPASTIQK